MKNKFLISLLFLIISSPSYSQNENLFFSSLNGLNRLTDSVLKLWESFENLDNNINRDKIEVMTISLHKDVTNLIIAKRSILNKIKNQSTNDVDFGDEIDELEKSTKQLQATLRKYDDLIAAVGMDAQILSSDLNIEFASKLDNLKNLQNLLPNNNERKEVFITYLESGINILNGTKLLLERFNQ